MTTPRIEEVVEEFMASFNWDAITSDNKSNLKAVAKELTQALTEAHQAGIDEAVEKMKMKGDMGKLTPFQETVNTYIKNRGVEIRKALQDNK